ARTWRRARGGAWATGCWRPRPRRGGLRWRRWPAGSRRRRTPTTGRRWTCSARCCWRGGSGWWRRGGSGGSTPPPRRDGGGRGGLGWGGGGGAGPPEAGVAWAVSRWLGRRRAAEVDVRRLAGRFRLADALAASGPEVTAGAEVPGGPLPVLPVQLWQ